MDLRRFDVVLNGLVPKLESFARSLDPEERDVLASLLELCSIGAQEGKRGQTNQLLADGFILPKQTTAESAESIELSILADLPTRIYDNSNS